LSGKEFIMRHILRYTHLTKREILVCASVGLMVGIATVAMRLGVTSATAAQPRPQSVADIAATIPAPATPLSSQSTPAEVKGMMLNSHNRWTSLDLDATTVWHTADGDQTVKSSVQIEQFAKVRVKGQQWASDGHLMFDWDWVSDGANMYQQDTLKHTYQVSKFPVPVSSLEAWPKSEPPDDGPAIFRHPIAMLMESQLSDYIYSVGLVQLGEITLEGEDEIAGRKTVIVLWERKDAQGNLMNRARYWVDTQTGVVLKALDYAGDGLAEIAEETVVTRVSLDQPLAPETFSFSPAPDVKQVSPGLP
jgi:hypothetical protein